VITLGKVRTRLPSVAPAVTRTISTVLAKATPRDATTFDPSDRTGQGASYRRVELQSGGKKLFFVGLQKTYRKA
jgi:hypothetical protein